MDGRTCFGAGFWGFGAAALLGGAGIDGFAGDFTAGFDGFATDLTGFAGACFVFAGIGLFLIAEVFAWALDLLAGTDFFAPLLEAFTI